MTVKQSKSRLRDELRKRRRFLSSEERLQTAIDICNRLSNFEPYKTAQRIGVYLATAEEISLDPFIVQARKDQKDLFLPVVSKSSGEKRMFLQRWQDDDELLSNRYGISEPKLSMTKATAGSRHADPNLDLLLMPLVGYSSNGARLGMGAGYYDRYLGNLVDSSNTQRIGIAHSCQYQSDIPLEKWDKKMHYLVNEKEIIRFEYA